jgi:hypothetical protein
MTDPLTPNYKPGVGRLVVDRFDFQSHIAGDSFHHEAISIDLSPSITINSVTTTNVQAALAELAIALNPPVVQDATTMQKGIIQLTGDITGAATNIQVSGLRSYPVNTNVPSVSDVLTWDGSSWGPALNVNNFTATGDLSGTPTVQQVISLSGNGSIVTVQVPKLTWDSTISSPIITQDQTFAAAGQDLSITAQSSLATGLGGGSVVISGGGRGLGGAPLDGGVSLRIGTSTPTNMFQAVELAQTRRITSLNNDTAVSNSNMGSGTGDLVTFIGDASSIPTSSPVGGSILYSTSGRVHVRQADGTDAVVGSSSNPDVWGSVVRGSLSSRDGQVYTQRIAVTTIGAGVSTVITFPIPIYTTVYVEADVLGKIEGSADGGFYKLSSAYARENSTPVEFASVDGYYYDAGIYAKIEHIRVTTAGAFLTLPTIALSGNNILVKTGDTNGSFPPGTFVTWFITAKFYVCPSYNNP